MFSSSPKISDPIENDFFSLNLAQKDEKLGYKFFSADLMGFWVSLTGSLRKGSRNKPCYTFKEAHLSESTTSEILELSGSFFFQNIGNLLSIAETQKKCGKKFTVFQIV